ncbi:MAG: triphosphoribosyl-dephospho-CoA synthase [Thermoleophilia bacterium]
MKTSRRKLCLDARGRAAAAAQLACLLEVGVHKPGNVSPRLGFRDTVYTDFVLSALLVGPAFREAPEIGVGPAIFRAVQDTRRVVSSNTNLGLILLLTPLVVAATEGRSLRESLERVLADLSVEDTRWTYRAIRQAQPGGLGSVSRYDAFRETPCVSLREVMKEARDRDTIAAEYAEGYPITFEIGYPAMREAWHEGTALEDVVLLGFLALLAQVPDTLIARKKDGAAAIEVSRRAAEVLRRGGPLAPRGRAELERLDRDLRDPANSLNPGTTADLLGASLFVLLTEGGLLEEFEQAAL